MPIVNKESITRIRKNFSCLFENVPSTRCVEVLDWTSCKWILRTNIQTFNSFQATGLFLNSLNTWDEWVNPLGANPTKLSNTLKQFVGRLPTNCLNVFEHFVELALKGLNRSASWYKWTWYGSFFHLFIILYRQMWCLWKDF